MITRRQAMTVVALATVASATARGQSTTFGLLTQPVPPKLKFDLRAFASYTFELDGKALTVTPEELMAGLMERKA
jgi:hypothetical protein